MIKNAVEGQGKAVTSQGKAVTSLSGKDSGRVKERSRKDGGKAVNGSKRSRKAKERS